MVSALRDDAAQPVEQGEKGDIAAKGVYLELVTQIIRGGEGAVIITAYQHPIQKDARVALLGHYDVIRAKGIEKDLPALHDSSVTQLAIENQDKIRGKLRTLAAPNEFNWDTLVQGELLADGMLESPYKRSSLGIPGIDVRKTRGGQVADNGVLG